MDPNWIMAIIALAAIFSPAIVSIIDNISKYKSKKLELLYPYQREALSTFISESLLFYLDSTYTDMIKYNIAKNNLYVYFKDVNDTYFEDLKTYKDKLDIDNYRKVVDTIVKNLSQQLNK